MRYFLLLLLLLQALQARDLNSLLGQSFYVKISEMAHARDMLGEPPLLQEMYFDIEGEQEQVLARISGKDKPLLLILNEQNVLGHDFLFEDWGYLYDLAMWAPSKSELKNLHQVIRGLKSKFNREKIALMAQSKLSSLALAYAREYPQELLLYFGLLQERLDNSFACPVACYYVFGLESPTLDTFAKKEEKNARVFLLPGIKEGLLLNRNSSLYKVLSASISDLQTKKKGNHESK